MASSHVDFAALHTGAGSRLKKDLAALMNGEEGAENRFDFSEYGDDEYTYTESWTDDARSE